MSGTSLASAIQQRYDAVAAQIDLLPLSTEASCSSVLNALSKAPHLDPRQRAGVSWLVCTGRYAKEFQQEALAIALDAGDMALANQLLARGLSKTPRRVRSRRLVTVDKPLLDVTRTALETGLSGIPRIVRLLARHGHTSDSVILVVWVAGAPARVQLDPSGAVDYPGDVWGSSRGWFTVSRGLRVSYWRLMSRLATLPGGSAIHSIVRLALAPFKLLDIGVSVPQEIVLIPSAGVFEPEVTARQAVDRLLPWLEGNPEIPLTILVHDALPLTHPQYFSRDQRLEFLHYARLLQRGTCLIVATEQLRQVMLGWSMVAGRTEPPRIEIVDFPTYSQTWNASTSVEVSSPAFYMVGSPEGRKNVEVAVAAMHLLARNGRRAELHIIGARRGVAPRLRQAINNANTAGATILLQGAVADDVLAGFARQSKALLYLSKAEGFGLPVREAQAMGCPVIASDIPSNVALARSGGVTIVDHRSPTAVAHAMGRLMDGCSTMKAEAHVPSAQSIDAYAEAVLRLVTGQPPADPCTASS